MSSGEPASTAPPDPEPPKVESPTAAAKDAKRELTQAGPPVDHSSAREPEPISADATTSSASAPPPPLPLSAPSAAGPAGPAGDYHAIEPAEGSVESDEFEPEEWEDGSSSASTSINSSIYAHTYENGRRFHSFKNGRYPIPNDDQEQHREDMKHAMMLEMTDGKLFYSPVGDYPQKIIDIGTGTGIWAIEAGDRYPSASVMGIDLSPIQPVWIPPNVKFIIDDCEDEWLNGDNYDLVHFRFMAPVLKDVPKMCRQAFENIKPGGWIEWQELHAWMYCDDGTMPPNDSVFDLYKLVDQAFKKMDFDVHLSAHLGDVLKAAGFVNVQCVIKKIPVGAWARDKRLRLVGHYLKTVIHDFLPALTNKPLLSLGMNEVECQLWRAAAAKALDDQTIHRYWNFYFWHAQKPE